MKASVNITALNHFTEFTFIFYYNLYLFIHYFIIIIIIICMNIFFKVSSSMNVLLCLKGFFYLLLYNEYSYLQPVLHLYTCMYFVPENKLIRVRIRIRNSLYL